MVSAEAMATVRRVIVMDRDAETDRDTTEETVHRVTVTDRDAAEIVRDITEETVRRAIVTDRDAETDQDITEETVRRVTVMDRDAETDRDTTVTDRDAEEIVQDITEATVRRMVDVTAVEDRAQEAVQAVRRAVPSTHRWRPSRRTEDTITLIIRSRKNSTKMRISAN